MLATPTLTGRIAKRFAPAIGIAPRQNSAPTGVARFSADARKRLVRSP
jgi:hypothetical protein